MGRMIPGMPAAMLHVSHVVGAAVVHVVHVVGRTMIHVAHLVMVHVVMVHGVAGHPARARVDAAVGLFEALDEGRVFAAERFRRHAGAVLGAIVSGRRSRCFAVARMPHYGAMAAKRQGSGAIGRPHAV